MEKSIVRRLRDRAVVTAAILAMVGANSAIAADPARHNDDWNDRHTASPIKHVIVILGENRTFDHVFATYQTKPGQKVDNLLSKGIITIDGAPGPHFDKATQHTATDTTTFEISPGHKMKFGALPEPGTSYAPLTCYSDIDTAAVDGPGCLTTIQLAHQADTGLDEEDYGLLLTGATGLTSSYPDSRIWHYNNLADGPYPLIDTTQKSLFDTYGGSPVHRFYQMWQELDCSVAASTSTNPSGCQADLFPWVETTISSGTNGGPAPAVNHEGAIAMGFYNVSHGDAPYLTRLANEYTLSDNFHQSVMGGTGANHLMFGYADAIFYADSNGQPAVPATNQIENPNPQPGTNNIYTQDGYSGGSYTKCSDATQPGVDAIADYLKAIHVDRRCMPNAYYLLNNYNPGYYGDGTVANTAPDPAGVGPFTIPPTEQRHIGDVLSAHDVSWAYFGEGWNQYVKSPITSLNPTGYLYCNICNPFQYSTSTMANEESRERHIHDTPDLYDDIMNGNLPAVSIVKPDTFNDGHPASSKLDLFESFTAKIIEELKSNKELWETTAVFITFDEGGGYYDSGYVQPVDYFGDGTRIPLLVVSPFTRGGNVSHEYGDHVSIIKFIERNWDLPTIGSHTRDGFPNPRTAPGNDYVPTNGPAIGDLWSMFSFHDGDDDRDN